MALAAEEFLRWLLFHTGDVNLRFNVIFNTAKAQKLHLFSISLQDTCVALQALSEYAILSYVGGVNLTISLASTNLDFQETFELNRDNKKLLQSARVTKTRFCLWCFSLPWSTVVSNSMNSTASNVGFKINTSTYSKCHLKRLPCLIHKFMSDHIPELRSGISH